MSSLIIEQRPVEVISGIVRFAFASPMDFLGRLSALNRSLDGLINGHL